MQQLISPAIGLCGSFAQRDDSLSSIPLLFLQVWQGVSRHHKRSFTAFAELNITNPFIPIYVGRNLFHKDTSQLYVLTLRRSRLQLTKISLWSATVN
jgi:hypothetical protein